MHNLLTPFSGWEQECIYRLQEKSITLHFHDGRKEEKCAPYTILFGLQDGVLIAWPIEEKQPATYCLSDIHSFDIGESFYFMRSETVLMKRIVQEQNQNIFNQKD